MEETIKMLEQPLELHRSQAVRPMCPVERGLMRAPPRPGTAMNPIDLTDTPRKVGLELHLTSDEEEEEEEDEVSVDYNPGQGFWDEREIARAKKRRKCVVYDSEEEEEVVVKGAGSAYGMPFGNTSAESQAIITTKVTLSSTNQYDSAGFASTSVPEFIGNHAEVLGMRLESTAVKSVKVTSETECVWNLVDSEMEVQVHVQTSSNAAIGSWMGFQSLISLPHTSECGSDIIGHSNDSESSWQYSPGSDE